MTPHQFAGVHTALITPMERGKIAYEDLEDLLDFQIKGGINGLVPVGTTGESPTLSHSEHIEVVKAVIKFSSGRVPVIAGTGSNSTEEAVELTKAADKAGADAVLQVAPYYNRPSQDGLFKHFSAVARVTKKPIILYSIPGRCGIEIAVETCARLYEKFPHILGIKESGGSALRVAELSHALGEDYLILSGDDPQTLPFMSVGAKGVISVASNLIPKDCVDMVNRVLDNDLYSAQAIGRKYQPFFGKLLSLAPNPVPIKQALHDCGMIRSPEVRLPLVPLDARGRKVITAALQDSGLV